MKRQAMAAEYRELARKSAAIAAASLLDNVREKHARAALQWEVLAALNERSSDCAPGDATPTLVARGFSEPGSPTAHPDDMLQSFAFRSDAGSK